MSGEPAVAHLPSFVDHDPRNLPQDLLASIGLMAACAAKTENVVELALTGCLGVSIEYGLALTPHMNLLLRLDVLKSAAEIRIDDLDALDELDGLLDRIEKAFRKRNDVVHQVWVRHLHTGEVGRVHQKARGKVEAFLFRTSADEVRSDALLVHQSGVDLSIFMNRHNLWPREADVRPSPLVPKQAARKERRQAKKKKRRAQT
jgi:hypothetical protein